MIFQMREIEFNDSGNVCSLVVEKRVHSWSGKFVKLSHRCSARDVEP